MFEEVYKSIVTPNSKIDINGRINQQVIGSQIDPKGTVKRQKEAIYM